MKNIKKITAGILSFVALTIGITLFVPNISSVSAVACPITLAGGAGCAKTDSQATSLFGDNGSFTDIINTILFVIGAISVVMLIYGGVRYTISGGDSGAVTNAKNTILYAIVGVIVSVLAFAIVNFVIGALK